MKVDIECHNCKKEFIAEQDVQGKCPHCNTKYDWYWDGEVWSETETCCPLFETADESVKKAFLITRDWI